MSSCQAMNRENSAATTAYPCRNILRQSGAILEGGGCDAASGHAISGRRGTDEDAPCRRPAPAAQEAGAQQGSQHYVAPAHKNLWTQNTHFRLVSDWMPKAESRLESSEFKLREHVTIWKRSLYKAAEPTRIRTVLILVAGSVFRERIRIHRLKLPLKGTQVWEFFWLRFWNLRYFFVSYA